MQLQARVLETVGITGPGAGSFDDSEADAAAGSAAGTGLGAKADLGDSEE
jgi:hypothetical protein